MAKASIIMADNIRSFHNERWKSIQGGKNIIPSPKRTKYYVPSRESSIYFI